MAAKGAKTKKTTATAKTPTPGKAPGPLCQTCKKSIEGECMKAFGKFWHPEHFICAKCNKQITGPFNMKDEKLYCKADYSEMFLERCPKCGLPVDEGILAMGKTWHPDHFLCTKCGLKLTETPGERFAVDSGQPYCQECFQKHFLPVCFGCKAPITETCVSALDKKWHEKCFKCSMCNAPLTEAFVLINEKPVCRKCAKI